MIKLERVSAFVLGTSLVVTACAATTDAELTPVHEEAAAFDDESRAREGLTRPDAKEGAKHGDEVDDDARSEGFAADLWNDDEQLARGAHHQRCDRRNNWHCRRGHRGWRWISATGPYSGWSHGRRCCVRIRRHHHPHW